MKTIKIKSKFIPQYSTPDYCICSHDNFIYKFFYNTKKFKKICELPPKSNSFKDKIKNRIARSWLYRTFVSKKFGINHAVELPSGVILILYDKLYRFDPAIHNQYAEPVDSSILNSFPLKNGFAVYPDTGDVYFGDYICSNKQDINIYKIEDNGLKLSICHTFKKGTVQHIHGVHYDNFRNRLWVTTGDDNSECAFYYTDDCFREVKLFCGGDQSWRAVSLVPLKKNLVWGMDAGQDALKTDINYTYQWDFERKERSKIGSFKNPTYHMAISQNCYNIFFGVNFEPQRKQESDAAVTIWRSGSDLVFTEMLYNPYLKSNITGVSRYGYVFLPLGELPKNTLLYTCVNVENNNFDMMMVKT
ncbi:hypothetical protein [Colwellia hornerae]|uniref:Uncharacterized protein n=1 Tax=Colwellia hornerae TaxID=89402 RepID=A0A5C6QI83_9GAMM|nr:hypothetical protein [Colwellia hornerae]TWX52489.1 hypothetical protein ESZ28_12570 [Colwellia hornerae]TWX58318.1 hypothetical protein ESZ26_12535 [Colwellia hornerae]TWX68337.1 hypothetical protein ESZ27_06920 [Colwellia hornerae]